MYLATLFHETFSPDEPRTNGDFVLTSCNRVKKGGWMPALVNTSDSRCRKTLRKADTRDSGLIEVAIRRRSPCLSMYVPVPLMTSITPKMKDKMGSWPRLISL